MKDSALAASVRPPLGPVWRLFGVLATWLLLFLASPGLLRPHGFGHGAFVALAPWALVASRPGRRARTIEWAGSAVGLAAFSYWLWPVLPWVVPLIGVVTALYLVLAGVVLRRLARRWPLALAVPLAWLAGELPRFLLPFPLSFGWWRVGMLAHDTAWLAGSARVWGTFGLTYVFAAFGGLVADGVELYRGGPHAARARLLPSAACGLLPLLCALGLSFGTRPPATVDGPRLLLVQPGLEQRRKAFTPDPLRNIFGDACELTRGALDELARAGEPPPDLVAWGETMLYVPLAEKGFLAGVQAGARPLPWSEETIDERDAQAIVAQEPAFVGGLLFGRAAERHRLPASILAELQSPWLERVLAGEPLLPPGTSFLAGAVLYGVRDGAVRRLNAGALWNGRGERTGLAAKLHLVPLAESPSGTEHLPFLLDAIRAVGGYVPDFVAAPEPGVLDLEARDGRTYRMAVSICYDNAFDDTFRLPARAGELDFHLVASNEAWYEESVEMEHMLAFSRLQALATGRSVVRVTNSGISCVIDPAGRERVALTVAGRRRMVRGSLSASVPVPDRSSGAAPLPTPYVRSGAWQWTLWVLAILVAALPAGRGAVTRPGGSASAPTRPTGNAGGA